MQSLEPGLYFVATPIGSARDITLRGLDILGSADVLAAEDTRNTRRLLDIHGVALRGRPLLAYHDHNGAVQRPKLLAMIREGKSVACVSDAGTPLIADPGFALARDAIADGQKVVAAPGASSVLAALAVAGLPTDQFFFAGFLPHKPVARRRVLAGLAGIPGSLVIFESARRVGRSLTDMVQELGGDRQAALCRELTKKFETVDRGDLAGLAATYENSTPKGEIVVVIGPAPDRAIEPEQVREMLMEAISSGNSLRDAVDLVAGRSGAARKFVYQLALETEHRK